MLSDGQKIAQFPGQGLQQRITDAELLVKNAWIGCFGPGQDSRCDDCPAQRRVAALDPPALRVHQKAELVGIAEGSQLLFQLFVRNGIPVQMQRIPVICQAAGIQQPVDQGGIVQPLLFRVPSVLHGGKQDVIIDPAGSVALQLCTTVGSSIILPIFRSAPEEPAGGLLPDKAMLFQIS